VDQPTYHVLLDGRTVGPYDRRTILGMRIKHMLTGDHLLVTPDGARLTVRDLIGVTSEGGAEPAGDLDEPGAQAASTGMLVDCGRGGFAVPRFQGEVEVRVQREVLRLAGRYRRALRWRDGRVKLPLKDVVYARGKGPRTDIWLQAAGASKLQRLALYMFTSEAADELAARLAPAADAAHPALVAAKAAAAGEPPPSSVRVLAVAIGGVAIVVALVLLVLLYRRV
jgi:hypothetical protein